MEADVQSRLAAARISGGAPLPAALRRDVEGVFGADFGAVRLHDDPQANALSRDVGAHAFTLGSDIFFSDPGLDLTSDNGVHLLAHELTHSVQQGASSPSSRAADHQILPHLVEDLHGAPAETPGQKADRDPGRSQVPCGVQSGVLRRSMMRGDKPKVSIKKDGPPPTTASLLLGRYEAIIKAEKKLLPGDLTKRAVGLFTNANPRVVQPQPPAQLTIAELIVNAIYDLQHAYMDAVPLTDFLPSIATTVAAFLLHHGAKFKNEAVAVAKSLPDVTDQFLPFVTQAELALYTDPMQLRDHDIRDAVAATLGYNPDDRDSLDVAAEVFIAGERRGKLADPFGGVKDVKNALIAALETMPVVQAIYRGDVEGVGPDRSGLKLTNTKSVDRQRAHFEAYYQKFVDNATTALKRVYGMVEPARRPPVDRIKTMEVNPDEIKERFLRAPEITSFRADANRRADRVRLSVMAEVPTIVHELGHHVEFALPIAVWLDLIQILQERAGGRKMIDIYGTGEEIAFDAAMPAFEAIYGGGPGAKYAAKIYQSGDTEIISMSLEMFSQPEQAKKLINEDPLLAATVLRSIRPQEFDAIPRELRQLLPRGAYG